MKKKEIKKKKKLMSEIKNCFIICLKNEFENYSLLFILIPSMKK